MKNNNSNSSPNLSKVVWSNICKIQYLNDMSDKQLAEAMNVTTRTLQNYKDNPSKITLKTLELFLENLSVEIDDLIA